MNGSDARMRAARKITLGAESLESRKLLAASPTGRDHAAPLAGLAADHAPATDPGMGSDPGHGFGPGPGHGRGPGFGPGVHRGARPTLPTSAAFRQLQADEATIAAKSGQTPELDAALRESLAAIRAAATTTPDHATVATLDTDLEATTRGLPTVDQVVTLKADLSAIATAEGVADGGLVAKADAAIDAVVAASTVTADDLAKLAADRLAAGLPSDAPIGPRVGPDLDALRFAVRFGPGDATPGGGHGDPGQGHVPMAHPGGPARMKRA